MRCEITMAADSECLPGHSQALSASSIVWKRWNKITENTEQKLHRKTPATRRWIRNLIQIRSRLSITIPPCSLFSGPPKKTVGKSRNSFAISYNGPSKFDAVCSCISPVRLVNASLTPAARTRQTRKAQSDTYRGLITTATSTPAKWK